MDKAVRKSKKKKIILWIVAVVVVVIFALLVAVGNYLVSFALKSDFEVSDIQPDTSLSEAEYDAVTEAFYAKYEEAMGWLESSGSEDVNIISDDGYKLYAKMVPSDKDSHKWVICLHGYRGSYKEILSIAHEYSQRDFNILLPDLRGCGQSEGEYVGMGWLDRLDMLKWINLITEKDPAAEIVMHGVSMGGATVMMTAGEELPENVKVMVEDCGYTSVWDIFSDEVTYIFGLPPFPILNISSGISKLRAGYTFFEASSVKQLQKARVPVLFIHGSQDTFVHTEMVYKVYEACTTEKEILVVDGADHGMSNYIDPELYFQTVFDFTGRYINDNGDETNGV